LARIARLLRGQNKRKMLDDLLRNRAQYAVPITILAAFLVLAVGSVFVLQAESHSETANILTGGDALWWAMVTITTVGDGDRYPTTLAGRLAAKFVMVTGIGIIGSLASIMASLLVSPAPAPETGNDGAEATGLELKLERLGAELAGTRNELAAPRQLLERPEGDLGPGRSPARPADGTPNASEPKAPRHDT
jgi:hypothetical protein